MPTPTTRHSQDPLSIPAITIRPAANVDARAIARLIEHEEARPLEGASLVAELDGVIVAALSLHDDRAVADIFRATQAAVEAMRRWCDVQRGSRPRRWTKERS